MEKIDFSDICISIPFRLDSDDRIRNMALVIDFYERYCKNLQFAVVEYDLRKNFSLENRASKYLFIEGGGFFNKSLCYNASCRLTDRKILMLTDCDVLIDPNDIFNSIKLHSDSDFVIKPYTGVSLYFHDNIFDLLSDITNIGVLKSTVKECKNIGTSTKHYVVASTFSPGGCILIKRDSFITNKGFNTKFGGWGFEDNEFLVRMEKLGLKMVTYLGNPGVLFHLPHKSSTEGLPTNSQEYSKICSMNKQQILDYIKDWPI